MKLANVKQIFETSKWEEANKYLDLGWLLLDVYHQACDTFGPGLNHQTIYYSLGWCKESEPVVPEKEHRYCYGEIF